MTSPTWADRVQETFTTTGTGVVSLGGAVTGYRAFSAVMANAGTCYYCMTDGVNWEVGLGTYTTAGNTLTRTTVIASSNANAAVNWAAGTKNVWLNFPASLIPGPSPIATNAVAGIVIPDGTIITVDGSGNITVPKGSSSAFGVVKVDGTTITATAGVISAGSSLPTALGVGAYAYGAHTSGTIAANGTDAAAHFTLENSVLIGASTGVGPTADAITGTWKAMQSQPTVNGTYYTNSLFPILRVA